MIQTSSLGIAFGSTQSLGSCDSVTRRHIVLVYSTIIDVAEIIAVLMISALEMIEGTTLSMFPYDTFT